MERRRPMPPRLTIRLMGLWTLSPNRIFWKSSVSFDQHVWAWFYLSFLWSKGHPLVAGVEHWNVSHTNAYGASCSLYEVHPITHRHTGDPIADCFAIVARVSSTIMVLADGVNWGVKSRTAARSAVHGCVDYLNKTLFPTNKEAPKNTTVNILVYRVCKLV